MIDKKDELNIIKIGGVELKYQENRILVFALRQFLDILEDDFEVTYSEYKDRESRLAKHFIKKTRKLLKKVEKVVGADL
jgi:hypothetical protein